MRTSWNNGSQATVRRSTSWILATEGTQVTAMTQATALPPAAAEMSKTVLTADAQSLWVFTVIIKKLVRSKKNREEKLKKSKNIPFWSVSPVAIGLSEV
jgi:hypothetical protein